MPHSPLITVARPSAYETKARKKQQAHERNEGHSSKLRYGNTVAWNECSPSLTVLQHERRGLLVPTRTLSPHGPHTALGPRVGGEGGVDDRVVHHERRRKNPQQGGIICLCGRENFGFFRRVTIPLLREFALTNVPPLCRRRRRRRRRCFACKV